MKLTKTTTAAAAAKEIELVVAASTSLDEAYARFSAYAEGASDLRSEHHNEAAYKAACAAFAAAAVKKY